jgi:hypothetical protein
MPRFTFSLVLAAIALLAPLLAGTAYAQLATTYIASNGVDNDGCGQRTVPCESFTKAISHLVAGGQVRCIDQIGATGFGGTVTITQSVIIDCKGDWRRGAAA